MKTEEKINKLVEYFESERNFINLKDKEKYLDKLIESFSSKDGDLLSKYKEAANCRERGGAKELLDSSAGIERAMDLRKQNKFGIFAIKDYVSIQAMEYNYGKKIKNCNAMMSRIKE